MSATNSPAVARSLSDARAPDSSPRGTVSSPSPSFRPSPGGANTPSVSSPQARTPLDLRNISNGRDPALLHIAQFDREQQDLSQTPTTPYAPSFTQSDGNADPSRARHVVTIPKTRNPRFAPTVGNITRVPRQRQPSDASQTSARPPTVTNGEPASRAPSGADSPPLDKQRKRTTIKARSGVWELGKTIGAGSMGKVKLARHVDTHEQVAVKIVPRLSTDDHKTPADRERADRSKEVRTAREAAICTLVDHPYICGMRDVVRTQQHWYLLFEYVNGGQMLDYIISHGSLKEKQARKFARQIASALDYCHKNSIVHRDLKIENILISKTGDIKIIDFGLSNTFAPGSHLKTFCGSLYFAAPELLQAKEYTGPEVDVWSFGIVLYVLVCGKVPFDDQSMPQLHAKIKRGFVDYPSWLGNDCRSLISRMLVTDPKQRATMSEISSHPWLTKGYGGAPENFLPYRRPLALPLDRNVIRKMDGFDFGTASDLEKKLYKSVESDDYQKLAKMSRANPTPSQSSHPRRHLSVTSPDSQKKAGLLDFYRRRSSVSRENLSSPSLETFSVTYDPVPAFNPLISVYYLAREKLERDMSEKERQELEQAEKTIREREAKEAQIKQDREERDARRDRERLQREEREEAARIEKEKADAEAAERAARDEVGRKEREEKERLERERREEKLVAERERKATRDRLDQEKRFAKEQASRAKRMAREKEEREKKEAKAKVEREKRELEEEAKRKKKQIKDEAERKKKAQRDHDEREKVEKRERLEREKLDRRAQQWLDLQAAQQREREERERLASMATATTSAPATTTNGDVQPAGQARQRARTQGEMQYSELTPTKLTSAAAGLLRRFSTRRPKEPEPEPQSAASSAGPFSGSNQAVSTEITAQAPSAPPQQTSRLKKSFSLRRRTPSAAENVNTVDNTVSPEPRPPTPVADLPTRSVRPGLGRSISVNSAGARDVLRGQSDGHIPSFLRSMPPRLALQTSTESQQSGSDNATAGDQDPRSAPVRRSLFSPGALQHDNVRAHRTLQKKRPSTQGVPEETAAELAQHDASEAEDDTAAENSGHVRPVHLKGLFSVSTTSNKPFKAIEADISRVLDQLHIQYRQSGKCFKCTHAPGGGTANASRDSQVMSPATPGSSVIHQRHPSYSKRFSIMQGADDKLSPQQRWPETPESARSTPRRLLRQQYSYEDSDESDVDSNEQQQQRAPTSSATYTAGETTTHVQNDVGTDLVLKFEIYVVKVPLFALHGIQFKKITGGTWQYKNMAQLILSELRL